MSEPPKRTTRELPPEPRSSPRISLTAPIAIGLGSVVAVVLAIASTSGADENVAESDGAAEAAGVTEASELEPTMTEPAETEPAETEPAETEPAETEPADAARTREAAPTPDGAESSAMEMGASSAEAPSMQGTAQDTPAMIQTPRPAGNPSRPTFPANRAPETPAVTPSAIPDNPF